MDDSLSNSLFIRPLSADDLDQVVAVEVAAHSHPCSASVLESLLNRPSSRVLGLFRQQSLLGFAIISCVVDESELINIAIDPVCQGQGLGRHLLVQAMDQLPESIRGMFLEVRQSNQAAIGLYESLDFIETGVRQNYYPADGGREDAVLMARDFF
jgi:[ribosomal protein S18]-alanine N-acetyltransferase